MKMLEQQEESNKNHLCLLVYLINTYLIFTMTGTNLSTL